MSEVDPSVRSRRVARASLEIYGVLTLLGVLEAASDKAIVDSNAALAVLVAATSASIALAHAWSATIAESLNGVALTRSLIMQELRFAAAFLLPAGVMSAICILTAPLDDVALTITIEQDLLLGALFAIGFVGARHSGASWRRSLAWGAIDVSMGVLIVIIKNLLSLIGH